MVLTVLDQPRTSCDEPLVILVKTMYPWDLKHEIRACMCICWLQVSWSYQERPSTCSFLFFLLGAILSPSCSLWNVPCSCSLPFLVVTVPVGSVLSSGNLTSCHTIPSFTFQLLQLCLQLLELHGLGAHYCDCLWASQDRRCGPLIHCSAWDGASDMCSWYTHIWWSRAVWAIRPCPVRPGIFAFSTMTR